MDTLQLKSIQAPLKQKYREDPGSALITLKAEGRLTEGISCDVTNGKDRIKAGLHPATGGDGSLVCSAELLLEALASCAGVTLNAVSTAMGIHLTKALVFAEGDIDFRGTLGVTREVPVGFTAIRIKFKLETKETDKIPKLIELTERYCVVFQTLRTPPQISVSVE
jgi:uncharacterized OsmC-like protein